MGERLHAGGIHFLELIDECQNPAQLFLRGIDLLSAISTTRQQAVDALELVSRGLVVPVIEEVRPLEEASDAHQLVESGAVTGRLVLTP